jgi:adenylate cyclase
MAEAKRRLAAILAADVAGYSRLMGDDERATVDTLNAYREVFRTHITAHDGRVVDTAGDSVMAVFDSVVEAVQGAIAIQIELEERNADLADARKMVFRIGVNLGDVIEQDDGTIYGDGVNVAARLESLATPGGMMISESAHMQVEGKTADGYTDAGSHQVKNIARTVRAFAWNHGDAADVTAIASAEEKDRKPTVAVGTFEGVGQGEDVRVLAEGVREAVVATLSNQTGLTGLQDTSAADYVVTARIQGLGNRYRATARVFDRRAGEDFASDRFDGEISDLFESQDELAYRIYMSMRFAVYGREGDKTDERPLTEKSSQALLSQAGFNLFGSDAEKWLHAKAMLEVVLERQPDDFMALAMLSCCHLVEAFCGYKGVSREDSLLARERAQRAARLNEQSEFVHFVLSYIYMFCDSDLDAAEDEARRALELNPYYSLAMWQLGTVLMHRGRGEEGIELSLKAIEANPRAPINHRVLWIVALGQFALGQYEAAIQWAKRSDKQVPDLPMTLTILTTSAAHADQLDEMACAAARLRAKYPDFVTGDLMRWPFEDGAIWDRFVEGLRKAGLDDTDPAV